MLEGITFQFPKLGFILFFFLACEALCPLRTNPLYFPRTLLFGESETKPPLWMWIAKWGMISLFVVALMSPVREVNEKPSGYDILLALDPQSLTPKTLHDVQRVIEGRENDRFALYVPASPNIMIPLTDDYETLLTIVEQLKGISSEEKITRQIDRFFSTTTEGRGWVILLSEEPKTFVRSLPVDKEISIINPREDWVERVEHSHPPFAVIGVQKYYEYFYIYPLFLGFLSMLAYLYGRNQKGVR
jgi:Ca-activated chloride channel homolog